MTAVIRAKTWEQDLRDSKTMRLGLAVQEIEFIESEIYELKRKLKGYQKEIRDLQIELRSEVQS